MIKKTYRLTQEDQDYLISLASRYRAIQTRIDEDRGIMHICTTLGDNNEPTSAAASFKMVFVSNDPPQMPPDEYRRRILGQP